MQMYIKKTDSYSSLPWRIFLFSFIFLLNILPSFLDIIRWKRGNEMNKQMNKKNWKRTKFLTLSAMINGSLNSYYISYVYIYSILGWICSCKNIIIINFDLLMNFYGRISHLIKTLITKTYLRLIHDRTICMAYFYC